MDRDALWRFAYRCAFRLRVLYWRFGRPRLEGSYVAVWHAGRLLVVRNSYRRSLTLPAGGLARGETPIEAALRELREEVGLAPDAAALRYVGEFVDVEGPAEDHAHFFELHCDEEPVTEVDRREVVWAGFVRAEEALARGVVRVVRLYLESRARSGA